LAITIRIKHGIFDVDPAMPVVPGLYVVTWHISWRQSDITKRHEYIRSVWDSGVTVRHIYFMAPLKQAPWGDNRRSQARRNDDQARDGRG